MPDTFLARQTLREARETRQLTQRDVAERVGISQSHYAELESGIRDPSLPVALRIALVLHLTVEDLFARDMVRDLLGGAAPRTPKRAAAQRTRRSDQPEPSGQSEAVAPHADH